MMDEYPEYYRMENSDSWQIERKQTIWPACKFTVDVYVPSWKAHLFDTTYLIWTSSLLYYIQISISSRFQD